MSSFVHLRAHSTYSIRDGLALPSELVQRAQQLGYTSLALTDHANLFGAVKFSRAARAAGIKPILGMTLRLSDESQLAQAQTDYEIAILAKTPEGYRNLMRIATEAQTVSARVNRRGCVTHAFFAQHIEGLIVLGGWLAGDVGAAVLHDDEPLARKRLGRWLDLCGDNYYMEIQQLRATDRGPVLARMLGLATQFACAPVATNDLVFLTSDDYSIHRLRVNIHHNEVSGSERTQHPYTETQYMRSPAEMNEIFADLPDALTNSGHIAHRCNFLLQRKVNVPNFPEVPGKSSDQLLAEQAQEGMTQLLGKDWQQRKEGAYAERLRAELQVIADMRYSDYFLIVGDFVRWARHQQIPVGPGRGSGAGSLVAYATGITGLDPLQYNLLFERFLNKGRGSMPDFDIDVCMERREEVIAYIRQKYGEEAVVQVVSFGTLGARAAVRDVVRVLAKPYSLGDRIVDLIPDGLHSTLASPDQRMTNYLDAEPEARIVYDHAASLEGQVRNTGLHAAGVVITAGPIRDACPLYSDEEGKMLTQFDKNDLEEIGLVKFDVLGLRTLTLINDTLKAINKKQDAILRADQMHDEATLAMICRGETRGVFQLESAGMRDLATRMQPNSFEDIVSLIALFRPGPMELIDTFIANKEGLAKGESIPYVSPDLEDILKATYGIVVYQEQVMQMAERIAGFSLDQADVLRHAMGKKKLTVMQEQKQQFIEGAQQKGHDAREADDLYTKIEKFAGYGFNRSHAVGYGVLAYWTAFLKCHYPAPFMAAALSLEDNDLKRTAIYIDECKRLKLTIVPPCINESKAHFVAQDKKIYYGLASIKGIGRFVAQALVDARVHGPYTDLFDLCVRSADYLVNKRVLESLVRVGALNALHPNQAALMAALETALQVNKKHREETKHGLTDMFADKLAPKELLVGIDDTVSRWSPARVLREEYRALGFYLWQNPFEIYSKEIRRYVRQKIADLRRDTRGLICGWIYRRRYVMSQSRHHLLRLAIRDESGELNIVLLPNVYDQVKDSYLKENNIIALEGELTNYRNSTKTLFDVKRIYGLAQLRSMHCAGLLLRTPAENVNEQFLHQLKLLALQYVDEQGLPLLLRVETSHKHYEMRLFKQARIAVENNLLMELEEKFPFLQSVLPIKGVAKRPLKKQSQS